MKIFVRAVLAVMLCAGLTWAVPAGSQKQTANKPAAQGQAQDSPPAAKRGDRGAAYYHYSLAHLYDEMASAYNRQDYLNKAIEEYKAAMAADPDSSFLSSELADLYARSGRLRDAVLEAEEVIKRDPNNLEARRLLGRIYVRVLGDQQGGRIQGDVLKRAIEQYEKIAEADKNDVDTLVTLARLYRINNDFTKAETVLKQALAVQPDSEDALTELAFIYTATSQYGNAVDLLEKVTAKNNNPRLFAALGAAYEQSHNYDAAVNAYRKAVALDKDNPEYMRSLGQNLIYTEQFDEAVKVYQALAQSDPQDGNAFLRLGQVYRQQGKFDLAAENLRKAASLSPDSLEVPFNQALLAESRGQSDEAITLLKGLLDKTAKPNPATYTAREKSNRAIFLERLGAIYRSNEDYQAAEDTFRQMLDADQENAIRGYTQLVETLRQEKKYDRALGEVDAAVKKYPDERSLKILRASVVAESGNVDAGVQQLRTLLQNKPDDREILLTTAQIYERAKRYPEAERAAADAEKFAQKKEEKEMVAFVWGSILERQKKYDGAETQFKKALAINGNSAMTLNYLGYMLADRGVRLEEARGYVERALQQDPANGAYLDSMGWVYYKMNKFDLAEQYLLKAIQRISKDPTIYDHLGDVYFKSGRLRDAVVQWQKAVAEAQHAPNTGDEAPDVAKIQKKVEDARVRLAQETGKK